MDGVPIEHRVSPDGAVRGKSHHSNRTGMPRYFSHLTPPKLVQKISADRQRAPENEA
jgi:hypothetical protein